MAVEGVPEEQKITVVTARGIQTTVGVAHGRCCRALEAELGGGHTG